MVEPTHVRLGACSGGEGGIPYELRLRMPQPSQREEWYSFDHGPIHFVQTSTEQPFGAGSPQWQCAVLTLSSSMCSRRSACARVRPHRMMLASQNES